jgi:hypothetical protein
MRAPTYRSAVFQLTDAATTPIENNTAKTADIVVKSLVRR